MAQNGLFTVNGSPLVVKKTYPFRIGFLNDIHVGSQYGLFPKEGYLDGYGTMHLPNHGQQILNEYLDDYAAQCRENKINHLWIPGDLIVGSNYKEAGKYILNIELEEQKTIAAKVIADFALKIPSIEKIYIWTSTGYHGSRDTSIDKNIAEKLRADYNLPAEFLSEYSIIRLLYKQYEKKIFITHTAPMASMYPEQAMGKDMMLWEEQVGKGNLPRIDMMIRAHKHNFIEVHKTSIRALQLPCWQFFVPYDHAMKNYSRYQPDIGSAMILFDEKMRATVWHFCYSNIIEPRRFLTISIDKEIGEKCLLKK